MASRIVLQIWLLCIVSKVTMRLKLKSLSLTNIVSCKLQFRECLWSLCKWLCFPSWKERERGMAILEVLWEKGMFWPSCSAPFLLSPMTILISLSYFRITLHLLDLKLPQKWLSLGYSLVKVNRHFKALCPSLQGQSSSKAWKQQEANSNRLFPCEGRSDILLQNGGWLSQDYMELYQYFKMVELFIVTALTMYFQAIIHRPVYYLKQRFGDWTLFLSSGKSFSSV
jgi:hypothetical protein